MAAGELWPGHSLKDLIDAGVPLAALFAAHQCGLLAEVFECSATPPEFAARLGLDPAVTRLTLNVLAVCGAVVYEDGRYGASAELVALERDAPGGVMRHVGLLRHLPELLRAGKPLMAMDGTLGERARHFSEVAPGLGNMYAAAAAELADALDGRVILDLGAGSGVWGFALAGRHSDAQVTAVDLPPVVEGLRKNAMALGIESRVRTIGASYFDAELREHGYDIVILGNVLHFESTDNAMRLVRRGAKALSPGGTLVVIDVLGNAHIDEYEPDPAHAMYALFLAARTGNGQMHPRAEVLGWLAAAGLAEAAPIRLPSAPPQLDCLLARAGHHGHQSQTTTTLGTIHG